MSDPKIDHLMDFLSGGEDLCPELREHVYDHATLGKILQHPLVFSVPFMDHPNLNKHLNKQLEYKKEALQEAKAKKDWGQYIFLHERPYRLDAIKNILREHKVCGNEYWEIIGSFWTDSENINQNLFDWIDLWLANEPDRESIMDDEEQEFLKKLPDIFEVFRGVGHKDAVDGLSWTLDKTKAIWFARRYSAKTPILATGTVSKSDVLAYFSGRNESEIVVLPENVDNLKVRRLPLKRK